MGGNEVLVISQLVMVWEKTLQVISTIRQPVVCPVDSTGVESTVRGVVVGLWCKGRTKGRTGLWDKVQSPVLRMSLGFCVQNLKFL